MTFSTNSSSLPPREVGMVGGGLPSGSPSRARPPGLGTEIGGGLGSLSPVDRFGSPPPTGGHSGAWENALVPRAISISAANHRAAIGNLRVPISPMSLIGPIGPIRPIDSPRVFGVLRRAAAAGAAAFEATEDHAAGGRL